MFAIAFPTDPYKVVISNTYRITDLFSSQNVCVFKSMPETLLIKISNMGPNISLQNSMSARSYDISR